MGYGAVRTAEGGCGLQRGGPCFPVSEGKAAGGVGAGFPIPSREPCVQLPGQGGQCSKGGVWVQNWPGGGCGHTGEKTGGSVVAGAGGDSQESELLLSNELPDLLMDSRQV